MKIVALKAHGRGYHGVLLDDDGYMFFQFSRNGRLRKLKRYPLDDFEDPEHFTAMMAKYMHLSAFIRPPADIDDLTLDDLDKVWHAMRKPSGEASPC